MLADAKAVKRSGTAMGSCKGFLPLPSMYFALKPEQASYNQEDMQHYVRKLFHPFGQENFFSDLPGPPRSIADTVEKSKATGDYRRD